MDYHILEITDIDVQCGMALQILHLLPLRPQQVEQ